MLVCGGRDFSDRDYLFRTLDDLNARFGFTRLIEGDAHGADRLAGEWADDRGIAHEKYIADWEGLGRKAGPLRNLRMLEEGKPDLVIAFPGGKGTAHMVRISEEATVHVIRITPWSSFT